MSALKKFYRHGGTLTTIPSNGFYQEEGNVSFANLSMVEVLPLTSADELSLTNPEYLLSGYAIEQILTSCVPGVKNVKQLPAADSAVLLLAIQKASNGNSYSTKTQCPKCEKELQFDIDIDSVLSNLEMMPDTNIIELEPGLVCHVKPLTLEKSNIRIFESFKLMNQVKIVDNAYETGAINGEVFQDQKNLIIAELQNKNKEVLLDCIIKMVADGEEVTDRSEISEFLGNCVASYVKEIDRIVGKFNNSGIRAIKCKCIHCSHEFDKVPQYDPTSFFAQPSQT